MRPHILLADDHVIVREGLVSLLQAEFDVVGEVNDGRTLIKEAERLQPDVVVTDVGMPLLNGLEAAPQIRTVAPSSKLVFLTQQSGKEYIAAAFRAGASAYVLKNAAASELIKGVREALAGRLYLSSELQDRFSDAAALLSTRPELFGNGLTARQREVLQLIAEGKSAKEIAHILDISIKTVEFHKGAIMDALGIRTTAELTRYAIEHGIVQD